jgi:predicted nucleic acid-binding protein
LTTLFLADTSAFTVALRSEPARVRLTELRLAGVVATFITVDLELGYSARSPHEHQGVWLSRAQLIQLACVDDVADRARGVQALLAAGSQHRAAGIIDLLTAAAAEHYGLTLLHYDSDFDHITAVTGQLTQWIVPPGTA